MLHLFELCQNVLLVLYDFKFHLNDQKINIPLTFRLSPEVSQTFGSEVSGYFGPMTEVFNGHFGVSDTSDPYFCVRTVLGPKCIGSCPSCFSSTWNNNLNILSLLFLLCCSVYSIYLFIYLFIMDMECRSLKPVVSIKAKTRMTESCDHTGNRYERWASPGFC